jgi:hypothetical protein
MFTQKRSAEKTTLSLTERTKGDPPDERTTDEEERIFTLTPDNDTDGRR